MCEYIREELNYISSTRVVVNMNDDDDDESQQCIQHARTHKHTCLLYIRWENCEKFCMTYTFVRTRHIEKGKCLENILFSFQLSSVYFKKLG